MRQIRRICRRFTRNMLLSMRTLICFDFEANLRWNIWPDILGQSHCIDQTNLKLNFHYAIFSQRIRRSFLLNRNSPLKDLWFPYQRRAPDVQQPTVEEGNIYFTFSISSRDNFFLTLLHSCLPYLLAHLCLRIWKLHFRAYKFRHYKKSRQFNNTNLSRIYAKISSIEVKYNLIFYCTYYEVHKCRPDFEP